MERGDSELSRMIEQEVARKREAEERAARTRELRAAADMEARQNELKRKEIRGELVSRMKQDAKEAASLLSSNGIKPSFRIDVINRKDGFWGSKVTTDSFYAWTITRIIGPIIDPPYVDPDSRSYAYSNEKPKAKVSGIALDSTGRLLSYAYWMESEPYCPMGSASRTAKVGPEPATAVGHCNEADDGDLVPLREISAEVQEPNDKVLHDFRASLAGAVARYL